MLRQVHMHLVDDLLQLVLARGVLYDHFSRREHQQCRSSVVRVTIDQKWLNFWSVAHMFPVLVVKFERFQLDMEMILDRSGHAF